MTDITVTFFPATGRVIIYSPRGRVVLSQKFCRWQAASLASMLGAFFQPMDPCPACKAESGHRSWCDLPAKSLTSDA